MAFKMSRELRKKQAEKIMDLANIGAGALLFGQFIAEQKFSWLTTLVGVAILVGGYAVSYKLHEGGEKT